MSDAASEDSEASQRQSIDSLLIGDVLFLFDAALDQLDKDKELNTRKIIDNLCFDVLNRIRDYLQHRSSNRFRSV